MNKTNLLMGKIGLSLALGSFVLSSIAVASVPTRGRVTDDTAIYQNLSEIRVARERELNFDSDIARLSALEGRYRERLPLAGALSGPMKRISQQKYRHSGHRSSATARKQ